jgi:predicted ATP-grasp superfamily ATP-dependent carboligase
MKKVLVLSTNSDDGKILLWCLREAKYPHVVIGNRSKNGGLRYSPLCKKFYEIPEQYSFEERSPEIIPIIARIVEREKIDVIVPSGFESVKFISQHQGALRAITNIVAVPTLDTIAALGNKYAFSAFCERHNIPHPRTYFLKNAHEINGDHLPLRFPVITKPLEMSSGMGIYKFEDRESLYGYIATQRADRFNALPLLLQEFIPGDDIDFNGFCSHGKIHAWTIQRFVMIENGQKPPLRWIQFTNHEEVFRLGKAIVEITRYSGPVNIDLRIDSRDGSVKTIEVNPRFWANTFPSICDGVNFADAAIRAAFDNTYTKDPRRSGRIWGTPHRVPFLILKHHNFKFIRYGFEHSFFQVRYLAMNVLFNFITKLKKILTRINHEYKKN